jgi:hypothetical protein
MEIMTGCVKWSYDGVVAYAYAKYNIQLAF